MATDTDFIAYIEEQAGLGTRLTHRRMFGEYALYVDGKVVAFACDNSLFVKPSTAAARLAPHLPQRPPYPGAKDYPPPDSWHPLRLIPDPKLPCYWRRRRGTLIRGTTFSPDAFQ